MIEDRALKNDAIFQFITPTILTGVLYAGTTGPAVKDLKLNEKAPEKQGISPDLIPRSRPVGAH